MIHHKAGRFVLAALVIATTLIVSAGSPLRAQAPQYPFDFKAYGVFRLMIVERNYRPTALLKDAVDSRTTDAVGAVSGLRGEISVFEGHLIISYGSDCGTTCPLATTETATLLATAAVRAWRPVQIDKDLDSKATETFIREQAKALGLDESKPFPFRITGAITNFVMHVNAAPNPRFKGHGSFDEMAVTGLAKGPRVAGFVVGFYAPPALQGVISHGGEYFHSHYVDAQKSTTAHLDTFGVEAGSTLMLPKAE